jgi:hypothetical protein
VGESHSEINPEPDDGEVIADRERRLAEARASSIEAGRRKGGLAGAAMAGAMLALRDIYEGPTKEEIPIEVEASGEPHNLDRDGVDLTVDGVDVSSPPLERKDPLPASKGRRSR